MGTRKKDYRDEDLALFHDMRRRERRKFLIPSVEDAEASPMSTPARTGRELLAADSEKNDFDWLLTPPSTPLFPSLDQDGPVANLCQRRILARSARLSYTQEPSPKVVRCGNPSSRGPSTVSSASSATVTSRARPLSPSFTGRLSPNLRSSSPCRPVTPTRRSSTASCRSSSRSLTPTLQRNNSSPSLPSRAGLPCGRNGGKSVSPKLGPWEPSLPGLSAEPPPPNLRTSLSDRTFQRGVVCVSKNRSKNQAAAYADTSDASNQPGWKLESPDVSRKWSSSYSIGHSSSQNSRASVVSYEDDVEMAESVLSGSTISDSMSKVANKIIPRMDDAPLRRSVLPAKRQMKSTGFAGDATSFVSVPARKSYDRQTAPRRSPHAMFRPLLSSAPISSFYDSRASGIRLHSSGLFTDPLTAQGTNFRGSRNDGFPMETTTGVSNANENCKPVHGCQETIEVENEGNSILEEQATHRFEGNCCPRAGEETLACHLTQSDNVADGHKVSGTINAGSHPLTSAKRDDGQHILGAVTGVLQAQCLMPATQDGKVQPEDAGCLMELKVTNLSLPTDSNAKGIHTCQEQHSCIDEQVASSISTETSRTGDPKAHERKVTENYVEDQKLSTSGKAHASFLELGNGLPQHGSQRVLSDLGSFRKQSLVKALHTRLHDSMPFGEKNGSCGSSLSDSRSLAANYPSANGSWQLSDCESAGHSTVGNSLLGSNAMSDKTYHYKDQNLHSSERDASKNMIQLCANLAGAVDDVYKNDVNSEGINMSALSTGHATSNLLELHSVKMGSQNLPGFEVSCGSPENLQAQASTSDKIAQHDDLLEFGSCVPAITGFVKDGVQYRCTEAGSSELIRKSIDISTAAGLAGDASHGDDNSLRRSFVNCTAADRAGEASHADDLTQRQAQGVLLSKRSVTLEEATDTILFCSSIVHELVYKAAAMAIDNENQRMSKPSISKRDFVALFGFSGAENKHDNRSSGLRAANGARNRMHRPPAVGTVRETSSFVQKQRMIHRQTPALTMRQSPMERIENAILGNHEEMHTPKPVVLSKKKIKMRKRARCRCSCCMM